MLVRVESGDIARTTTDCVVVNLFEGVTRPGGGTGAVDRALDGAISRLIEQGDIRGKYGELTLFPTFGKIPAPRVLVAGLGKPAEFSVDRVRDLSADIARRLRAARVQRFATITHGAGIAGLDPRACAQAIAEGTILGLYRFGKHKRPEEDTTEVEEVVLVEHDPAKVSSLEEGVELGVVLAEAQNFARDLANEPANVLTPTELAHRAQSLAAAVGLEWEILDRPQIEALGMGAFLGVAAGSHQPPKLIVLRYRHGDGPTLGLVGKGITFDTGGISIKPAAGMEEMKGDMAGGGAVIAAMGAIARLKPKINVTAIVPATENMPGGGATKPGDVLRAMSGKTIEVINTDAEGRLILADGITYARRLGCSPIVDVATLTGAISVTLGNVAFGLMGSDAGLVERIKAAAKAAGEKVWELPMFEEYREQIKSDVADIKNTGGRNAGSITAAFFLKEFAEDTPWAHLDIAGVDVMDKDRGALVKGASGIPVRTLAHLALSMSAL
ncbi:MAG TPA: leucyl aminopeptidase [Dehalococcoidia bacterium]|nr:leucyl aminopeptidase [Dehalococcoidia bacterium]